jgi:hypothetical protein
MQYSTHNAWTIEFRKNVHMYCHSLKATKDGRTFDVPCEDTPGNFVGIWAYQLSLNPEELSDLLDGLREWADQSGLKYRLYKTRESYRTNCGGQHFIAHFMFWILVAVVLFFSFRTPR